MTGAAPAHGARFELVRLLVDQAEARYLARVHMPQALYEYRLVISAGEGRCTLSEEARVPQSAADPEAWAIEHLHALARQIHRHAMKGGAWQRRLMRWREYSLPRMK